jgi:hypothetical protein
MKNILNSITFVFVVQKLQNNKFANYVIKGLVMVPKVEKRGGDSWSHLNETKYKFILINRCQFYFL